MIPFFRRLRSPESARVWKDTRETRTVVPSFLVVEPALEQRPDDRRIDRAPIEPRRADEIADFERADRQHVVAVEQSAVEPRDGDRAEPAVSLGHGAKQLGQHRWEGVGVP